MERRALVVVLAVLGAVPLASGLAGVLLGPEALPNGVPPDPSLDTQYRFANVFWLAAAPALWWSLRDLSGRRQVTRVVLGLAFVGGLARLLSVAVSGWPFPVFTAAMVLELVGVPLVLWWHARVVGSELSY